MKTGVTIRVPVDDSWNAGARLQVFTDRGTGTVDPAAPLLPRAKEVFPASLESGGHGAPPYGSTRFDHGTALPASGGYGHHDYGGIDFGNSMITGTDKLQVDTVEISNDAAAADTLELFVEALGTDNKATISADAQDLSATLDVNAKTLTDGAITAAKIATDAIGSGQFAQAAADKVWSSTTRSITGLTTAAIKAIWDQLTSALTTAGTIGKLLVDNINATISSRSTVTTAQVNTEVDTAISDARLDELMTTALGSQPTAGSLFGDLTEDDAGTQRFTTNALEQAPGGAGAGANPNVLLDTTAALGHHGRHGHGSDALHPHRGSGRRRRAQ